MPQEIKIRVLTQRSLIASHLKMLSKQKISQALGKFLMLI